MKACPVCQAVAFDDAAICYGCMHRFEEDEVESGPVFRRREEEERALPAFSIRFTPEVEEAGSVKWRCVVETA